MTKRWHACNDGNCTCGYIDRDKVFALKVIGEGDNVDPYLPEAERRDLIKRVTTLLNAAEGIPTEALEAGQVVVVPRAALDWLANGRTGASSEAMCYELMGGNPQGPNWHPADAGDFGRCLGLLDAVPQWRSRLHEVAELSPFWAAIVSQWDELERLYRAGDYKGCTEAMYAVLKPIYDDGLQQNGGEGR